MVFNGEINRLEVKRDRTVPPEYKETCPECGIENPEDSNFCGECGKSLKNLKEAGAEDRGVGDNPSINEMEYLDLTPAESLVILDPGANGKKMMKFTLIDLLVRRVIGIESKIERRNSISKKPIFIHSLIRGKAFRTSQLKPHEKMFRMVLNKNEKMGIDKYTFELLKQISSEINREIFSNYKDKYVCNHLTESGYMEKEKKKIGGILPKKTYKLTDYGSEVKSKIKMLLKDDKYLANWVKNDKKRAKAFLSACGTHILLNGYDMNTLIKFSRILQHEKFKKCHYYQYHLYSLPSGYLESSINLEDFNLDFMDHDKLDLDKFLKSFDSLLDGFTKESRALDGDDDKYDTLGDIVGGLLGDDL